MTETSARPAGGGAPTAGIAASADGDGESSMVPVPAPGSSATETSDGSETPGGAPTTTFELLSGRLRTIADSLVGAAGALNDRRAQVFAPTPLALQEQDRIRTVQPSIPRDAVAIGQLLLVGYNAGAALGRNREVADTFGLYRVRQASEHDWEFDPVTPDDPDWFLRDPGFQRDTSELFTYYSETRLDSLGLRGDRLLMVFRVGSAGGDRRVLRWQIADGVPRYIDAYGEHDIAAEEPYDFTWSDAGRELIVEGRWPHLRVDGLYIGIAQGHLEFRVDDAVEGGRTVLREPIAEPGQAVDELRVRYAEIGDVVLVRIVPYREGAERFYVFNHLTLAVQRVDALERNGHQLPEGQGIVFPGGYHLANGDTRVFTTQSAGFRFHALHRSPNGEDYLYTYHRADTGEYLLCAYNVVARTMDTPITVHGYALFPDGVIVAVRAGNEAQRVHTVAVYTSPFCAPERYAPAVGGDSFFGRIGNPDLVRAIGELLSLGRDARAPQFNQAVFEALVSRATALLDRHAWLRDEAANGVAAHLLDLRRAAGDVLDEFASLVAQKKEAQARVAAVERVVRDVAASAELELRDAAAFIQRIGEARHALGAVSELADVRQVDQSAVAALRDLATAAYEQMAGRAIEHLDDPDSLASLLGEFDAAESEAAAAATAASLRSIAARIDATGDRLVLLTEVVGGLDVEDPTRKAAVLARLADALSRRNALRAALDQQAERLRTGESASAFNAAMAVLSQRATAALSATEDAAACDAALAVLFAELENLELAYGDVAEFTSAIDARRDELHAAFSNRRDALANARTRRIDRIVTSSTRVLATIEARATGLADRAAIDAFFATDPLVARIRSACDQLRGEGEAGRAGELEVALATARDHARRASVDRAELFDAGTVRIGRWRFGVNSEPFELRLDADDGGFRTRLTGTDLALACRDQRLDGFADLVDQTYPSETGWMPRSLYLAFEVVRAGLGADDVVAFATSRIEDGYEPGVHDADARLILQSTRAVWESPALYIDGAVRAVAGVWLGGLERRPREDVDRQLAALRAVGPGRAREAFTAEFADHWAALATDAGLTVSPRLVTDYLAGHSADAAITATGAERAQTFRDWAAEQGIELRGAGFARVARWIADRNPTDPQGVVAEAAWAIVDPAVPVAAGVEAIVRIDGLAGRHPSIDRGALTLDVAGAFTAYLDYRLGGGLERFLRFTEVRRDVLATERARLDLDRLRPSVLSSFVRNRLIDEVYLPLVGDNVAKQLGMNGASQGLLLLISPPGYGKTTLMDYVVGLLGFALVKVNGPALGSEVTSLDPAAAPNAAAAEELEKLNRAFGMANNVVCYVDDVQHTSPEFLQKFIPLCDATRRIEGVLDGRAQTFALSGKRFVMIMAGNPYTSDGTRFRIPDMLANRADVHNLGDVTSSALDAFAQSYVEIGCGTNEVLAPLLGRDRRDLAALLRSVDGERVRSDQLSHAYGTAELDAVVRTLRHLGQVRDALLKVNAAYIASATVDDHLRGEPPFLLQGSYRNMARIAQRIVPAMRPEEVAREIADHYRSESHTLASAAAWNLAKLGEVLGTAGESERHELSLMRQRWEQSNVTGDPMAAMAHALQQIAGALGARSGPPTD